MPEYIEREAMRKVLENASINTRFADEPPAADVAPVVHGRWEETDWVYYDGHSECVRISKGGYLCTACRRVIRKDKFLNSDFCPFCGAKMDLEET